MPKPKYQYKEKDGKDSHFDVMPISGANGACGFASIYHLVGTKEVGAVARKKGVAELKKNIDNPKVRNLIKSELRGYLTSGDKNTQDLITKYKVINRKELNDIVNRYKESRKIFSNKEDELKKKYLGEALPPHLAAKYNNHKSYYRLLFEEPNGITDSEKTELKQLFDNKNKYERAFEELVESKLNDYINKAVAKAGFWLGVAGQSPGVLGALAEINNINFRVFSIDDVSGEMRKISEHMSNYVTPMYSLRLRTDIDEETGAEKSGYHFEVLREVPGPKQANQSNKETTESEVYGDSLRSHTTSSSDTTTIEIEGDTVMSGEKSKKLTPDEEYRLQKEFKQNIAAADKAVSVTSGDARAAKFSSAKIYREEIDRINELLKNASISRNFREDLNQLLATTNKKLNDLQTKDNIASSNSRDGVDSLNDNSPLRKRQKLNKETINISTQTTTPPTTEKSIGTYSNDENKDETLSNSSDTTEIMELDDIPPEQPLIPPHVPVPPPNKHMSDIALDPMPIQHTATTTIGVGPEIEQALQQDYWMIDRLFRRSFNGTADVIDTVNTALKNIHKRHPNFPMAAITDTILPFLRRSFESGPPGERTRELRIKSVVAMLCVIATIAACAKYLSAYAVKRLIQRFVTQVLSLGLNHMEKAMIMTNFISSGGKLTLGALALKSALAAVLGGVLSIPAIAISIPAVSFGYNSVSKLVGKKRSLSNNGTDIENSNEESSSKKRKI